MPVAGRKPKPDGQKRNRVKPTHDWVEVADVPFAEAPKLPSRMPDGRGWPAWTKRWWSTVSAMPHCVLWDDSDWQFAIDTALIAAEFHRGESRVATELRQREKILGTTMDARRDLRIRYVSQEAELEEAADVTSLADYRDALA
jgi:hypothetical protein